MNNILRGVQIFKDYSYVAFILSTLMTVLMVISGLPFIVVTTLFLFSAMDAIGYFHLLWGSNQNIEANNQEQRLVSYRFIQTGFQIILSCLIYLSTNLMGAAMFNLLWWFGVCDMLYYMLLKQDFIHYKNMFWLWWTPVGILKKIGILSDITGVTMLVQSIIGILLAIAIVIFL